MDRKQKERIIFLLDEIKVGVELLQGNEKEVISLDIILEDLRVAYREVELLRLLSSTQRIQGEVETKRLNTIVTQETITQENVITELASTPGAFDSFEESQQKPIPEIEAKEETQVISHTSTATVGNLVVDKLLDLEAPKPIDEFIARNDLMANFEKDVNGEKEIQFVADKLKVEDNSLYKKFVLENQDKSIASRLQATPIKSIKDSIGLNEKFLFINELFSGNIQQYNSALEKLNGFADANGAFEYLNTLAGTCDWNIERSESTIRTLVSLVQRRYLTS